MEVVLHHGSFASMISGVGVTSPGGERLDGQHQHASYELSLGEPGELIPEHWLTDCL